MLLSLFLALATPAPRTFTLPDVTVRTQSGSAVRFPDLARNRIAVMNFVFTSCGTICPTMGATFARVQTLLGDRADRVALISVSIDPVNDTPERLAAWSKRLGAKPGWTLVTGSKPDVDRILKALGVYSAAPATHTPVVLVGDVARGRWQRVDGLATPSAIIAAIDRVRGTE